MNIYKKNITFIVITALYSISIVSCNIDFKDIENKSTTKVIIKSPDIKKNINKVDDKITDNLKTLANKHLKELNIEKSMNNVEDIIKVLKKNDDNIIKASKKLNVDKSLIKTIIFREQLLMGFDDILADSVVKSYYEEIEKENLDPESYEGKSDSSTGLGQVFAKTAISAEISVNRNKELNPGNYNDIKDMWFKLQNDEDNVYYVALVLKEKARILGLNINNANREQKIKIISRYNGQGESAKVYAEQSIEYYDIFKGQE